MPLLVPGGNDFYAVKKSGRGSVRVAGCFCRGRPGGSLWGGGPSTAVAAVGTQRRHPGRRHGRRGGQRWLRAAIGAGPGGQEVGVRASCVSQPLPIRTQGSNSGHLHYRQNLDHLSHQGSPHRCSLLVKINSSLTQPQKIGTADIMTYLLKNE